jgi:hypothetical protein
MTTHATLQAAAALAVLLIAAGCRSQSQADQQQQQKVDQLQAQLDEMKKQLADKEAAASEPASAPAPAAAPQPPHPAASKGEPPTRTEAAPAAKQPEYVTAEPSQKAAAHYQEDQAKAREAIERQQAVNLQQAATNSQVQTQIEDLKSKEYTIPAGTVIPIRTTTELSTSKLSNGSVFEALLERSLVVQGTTLATQGAHVTGVVVSSDEGGRVKGVAGLVVTIRQIAGVRDQTIKVQTSNYTQEAQSTKGRDAKRTGIMTGIGAAVGAIAGGGKGAAIGAGAGAAAGVGTNMATKGEAATIPAETVLEFTLSTPATVVVRK